MHSGPLFAGVLAASILGSASLAQDLCDIPPSQWQERLEPLLVGQWEADNGPGIGKLGTLVQALPEEAPQLAVVSGGGDGSQMTMQSMDHTITYDIVFVPEEEWNYGASEGSPFASLARRKPEDLALLAGCDFDQIPRVRMQGSVPIQGTVLDMTLRFFLVSPNLLLGAGQWEMIAQGVNMEGRRVMALERVRE